MTFWGVGAGDQIYVTSWLQTILPTERTWMIHFEGSLELFLASSISTFFELLRRKGPNLKVPWSTKKQNSGQNWWKMGKHPQQTTFRRNKTKTPHSNKSSIDFPRHGRVPGWFGVQRCSLAKMLMNPAEIFKRLSGGLRLASSNPRIKGYFVPCSPSSRTLDWLLVMDARCQNWVQGLVLCLVPKNVWRWSPVYLQIIHMYIANMSLVHINLQYTQIDTITATYRQKYCTCRDTKTS